MSGAASSGNPYADLRSLALSLTAEQIGVVPSSDHPRLFGMVFEVGIDEDSATLVALQDGTVSLYLSSGGGIIGGGGQEGVWSSALDLLREADAALEGFVPDSAQQPPPGGAVRIYALTFGGLMAAQAPAAEITTAGHPLARLFAAANAVITAMYASAPEQ